MDIRKIAEEKYPDLDLRPFADKDGFIRNESPYWKLQEKRTAQRISWIDGVNWCVSQNTSTSEIALPISDVVKSLPSENKPRTMGKCLMCGKSNGCQCHGEW